MLYYALFYSLIFLWLIFVCQMHFSVPGAIIGHLESAAAGRPEVNWCFSAGESERLGFVGDGVIRKVNVVFAI